MFMDGELNVLERNFYVDDKLKSFFTVDESTNIDEVKELCSKGGFKLTKFTCNKGEILTYTKKKKVAKDRATGVK